MKIKPCPFCGGEAELWDNKLAYRLYGVICKECDCMTPHFTTGEDAIEAWNRREPIDKIVEQLEKIEVSRSEYSEIVECNIEPCTSTNCCECVVNKAIEIVKKGGVADEKGKD